MDTNEPEREITATCRRKSAPQEFFGAAGEEKEKLGGRNIPPAWGLDYSLVFGIWYLVIPFVFIRVHSWFPLPVF
jgi:hypothetical protein